MYHAITKLNALTKKKKKTLIALRINWYFYHLILNPINNVSQILALHQTQFSRTCTWRSMMYSATTKKLDILVNRKIPNFILFHSSED